MIRKFYILFLLQALVGMVFAQNLREGFGPAFPTLKMNKNPVVFTKDSLTKADFYVGGVARFFAYNGYLNEGFPGTVYPKMKTLYKDPFNQPLLDLFIATNTKGNINFGTQLRFFNEFKGADDPTSNYVNANFGVTLRAEKKSKYGFFQLAAGGIQWASLSPLTMGSTSAALRGSVFNISSYNAENSVNDRYDNYYNAVPVTNLYFGARPFQGINLGGNDLPGKMSFRIMYGKTDQNGSFNSYSRPTIPTELLAVKVKKDFNNGYVALNTINSYSTSESKNTYNGNLTDIFNNKVNKNFNMFTFEFNKKFDYFSVNGEIGLGSYYNNLYKNGSRNWSEGGFIQIKTTKEVTLIPAEFLFYQMGPNFINLNGGYANSTLPDDYRQQLTSYSANVLVITNTPVSTQMATNRRGVNINTFAKIGNLKLDFGYGLSSDMTKSNRSLALFHKLNGVSYSRFFGNNSGPYSRLTSFFNIFYDNIYAKDLESDGVTSKNLRSYSSLDFQAKYSDKILGKQLYLFYNSNVVSAQPFLSPLPVADSRAYIYGFYNELEAYFRVLPWLMVCGTSGVEIVKASPTLTEVNPQNGKARDQLLTSLGGGLDFSLGNGLILNLRHKHFSYEDRNFSDEKFKGFETTLDFKIIFW